MHDLPHFYVAGPVLKGLGWCARPPPFVLRLVAVTRSFLGRAIANAIEVPEYIISDQGRQFRCDARYFNTVIQQWDRAGDQWLEGYRRIEGYLSSRIEDAVRTEDATPPELEGKQEVALHVEG